MFLASPREILQEEKYPNMDFPEPALLAQHPTAAPGIPKAAFAFPRPTAPPSFLASYGNGIGPDQSPASLAQKAGSALGDWVVSPFPSTWFNAQEATCNVDS